MGYTNFWLSRFLGDWGSLTQKNRRNFIPVLISVSESCLYGAVRVAVVGLTNNVPGRSDSSSVELPVTMIIFYDYSCFRTTAVARRRC